MPRLEQLRLFEVPEKKNKRTALQRFGGYAKKNSERAKRDYYGTDPKSAKALLDNERLSHLVWEPTSGHGNIVRVLEAYGHEVTSTDIEDYGEQDYKQDFLLARKCPKEGMDIVMNPPYLLATEFVRHALDILEPGRKLCALLRIQFLEGQRRFDEIHVKDPPLRVLVFVKRQYCSSNDDFSGSSAVCYCLFVWRKGYEGEPKVKWL